jgi:hypothetical protein
VTPELEDPQGLETATGGSEQTDPTTVPVFDPDPEIIAVSIDAEVTEDGA